MNNLKFSFIICLGGKKLTGFTVNGFYGCRMRSVMHFFFFSFRNEIRDLMRQST